MTHDPRSTPGSHPPTAMPGPAVQSRYQRTAMGMFRGFLFGVLAAFFLIFSVYFLYDGYKGYHDANLAHIETARQEGQSERFDANGNFTGRLPHSKVDISLQRFLGFACLPIAAGVLAVSLYFLRGTRHPQPSPVTQPQTTP